jgi:hypothetical protein
VINRLLITLCLLVFGWFLLGVFIQFGISKWDIHKQALAKVNKPNDSHHYKTFRFTRFEMESLVWLKHKEFKYNEDHYDVVEVSWLHADSVTILCYKDSPETKFYKRITRLISKKSDKNKRSSSSPIWSNMLKTPVLGNQSSCFEFITSSYSTKINVDAYQQWYYQIYLSLETPPPKSMV